jgi:mRNA-degrading endonuclease toxin of MazEF toxin-antitoxin module
VLIDQLRSIDKRRIRRVFGAIRSVEQAAIDDGLELFLGLAARP